MWEQEVRFWKDFEGRANKIYGWLSCELGEEKRRQGRPQGRGRAAGGSALLWAQAGAAATEPWEESRQELGLGVLETQVKYLNGAVEQVVRYMCLKLKERSRLKV